MAYTWNNGEDLSITENAIHLMLKNMVITDVCRHYDVNNIGEINDVMLSEVLAFEKTLSVAHPLRLGIYAFLQDWTALHGDSA